jgi:hypothetical protein
MVLLAISAARSGRISTTPTSSIGHLRVETRMMLPEMPDSDNAYFHLLHRNDGNSGGVQPTQQFFAIDHQRFSRLNRHRGNSGPNHNLYCGNADDWNIETQVLIGFCQLDHTHRASVDEMCGTLDNGIGAFHCLSNTRPFRHNTVWPRSRLPACTIIEILFLASVGVRFVRPNLRQ